MIGQCRDANGNTIPVSEFFVFIFCGQHAGLGLCHEKIKKSDILNCKTNAHCKLSAQNVECLFVKEKDSVEIINKNMYLHLTAE